jgi:membrane-associated protease RseP (regulator of RpoE activity)
MKHNVFLVALSFSLGALAQNEPSVRIEKRVVVIKDGQKLDVAADTMVRHFSFRLDSLLGDQELSWKTMDGNELDQLIFRSAPSNSKPRLGVQITKIEGVNGVTIQDVEPVSTAAALGLQVGDVIYNVNDQKVTDPEVLVDVIQEVGSKELVVIKFRRDGHGKKVMGYLIPTMDFRDETLGQGPIRIEMRQENKEQ